MLIGAILLCVCAALFGYSYVTNSEKGIQFWAQILATGGGGAFLLYQARDKVAAFLAPLSKLFQKKEGDAVVPTPTPVPVPDVSNLDFTPSSKDLKDFSSLTYLKNRAVELGDKESFDTIIKLNTKIFSASVTAVPNSAKVEFQWDINKVVTQ